MALPWSLPLQFFFRKTHDTEAVMSTLSAREPPTPGQLIVPPPNFPLAWERPDDTRLFWTTDSVHYPDSVTPLEGWFLRNVYECGFNAAAATYRLPFRIR